MRRKGTSSSHLPNFKCSSPFVSLIEQKLQRAVKYSANPSDIAAAPVKQSHRSSLRHICVVHQSLCQAWCCTSWCFTSCSSSTSPVARFARNFQHQTASFRVGRQLTTSQSIPSSTPLPSTALHATILQFRSRNSPNFNASLISPAPFALG